MKFPTISITVIYKKRCPFCPINLKDPLKYDNHNTQHNNLMQVT